jgi:hypothetical protein
MISVIVASANPSLLADVSKNIADTVAVPYEIIAFNNSDGRKGICELYNEGIRMAKYDILCFMHEDIFIRTEGWGKIIKDKFETRPEYGLFGIAGSDYKSLAPSGLNGSGIDTDHANFIQHYKYGTKAPYHYFKKPLNKELADVACVDGAWFCVPKKIAAEILFDQETFKGFHAYDIDFSLAVGSKYKLAVIYDVLIEHFSEGNYDKAWMDETLKLHKKWYDHLPVNVLPHSRKNALYAEKATFQYFIERSIHFKYPMRVAFKLLYKKNKFAQMDFGLFLKLNYYILKKYATLK